MSFSVVSKQLPEFSTYFKADKASDCVKKMAKKHEGKVLVDFLKAALELNQWQTIPKLKDLIEKAVEQKKHVSKTLQSEFDRLKKVFQIAKKEKQLTLDPKNGEIKYALAKLYMDQKSYIPALSLLQSAQKGHSSPIHSSTKTTAKIIKQIEKCNKKVLQEAEALHSLVSKHPTLFEIEDFSKANIRPKISEVVQQNKELLPVEASLLRAYTLRLYLMVNRYMRGRSKLEKDLADKPWYTDEMKKTIIAVIEKAVPIIHHTLTKLPSTGEHRTLYRGMFVSPKFIDRLKVGQKFVNPAFTSTSTDRKCATDFSQTLLKTKKTEKLLFIINDDKRTGVPVGKIAYSESEDEILFRPNTEFRIKEIQKNGDLWVVTAAT